MPSRSRVSNQSRTTSRHQSEFVSTAVDRACNKGGLRSALFLWTFLSCGSNRTISPRDFALAEPSRMSRRCVAIFHASMPSEGVPQVERRKKKAIAHKTFLDALRVLLSSDDVKTSDPALLVVYRRGWSANQQGQYRSFNPHAPGSADWMEWNRGWTECSKLMRRRQSDQPLLGRWLIR